MKGIQGQQTVRKRQKVPLISEIVTSEKCVNLRAKTGGGDSLAAPVNRAC